MILFDSKENTEFKSAVNCKATNTQIRKDFVRSVTSKKSAKLVNPNMTVVKALIKLVDYHKESEKKRCTNFYDNKIVSCETRNDLGKDGYNAYHALLSVFYQKYFLTRQKQRSGQD